MSVYRRGSVPFNVAKELQLFLTDLDMNLDAVLNKGVSFEDNFNGEFVTFTSNATPDTEDTVTHHLKKAPAGFIVTGLNKGAVIYAGGTMDTETEIHLKSTVASTLCTIFIF